jgi:hypothetical protein
VWGLLLLTNRADCFSALHARLRGGEFYSASSTTDPARNFRLIASDCERGEVQKGARTILAKARRLRDPPSRKRERWLSSGFDTDGRLAAFNQAAVEGTLSSLG